MGRGLLRLGGARLHRRHVVVVFAFELGLGAQVLDDAGAAPSASRSSVVVAVVAAAATASAPASGSVDLLLLFFLLLLAGELLALELLLFLLRLDQVVDLLLQCRLAIILVPLEFRFDLLLLLLQVVGLRRR